MKAIALLCCVLWSTSVQAAGLIIAKDGYYLVEQTADGVKTTKFAPGQIMYLDAPTPGPPTDTPAPPTPSDTTKRVETAARAVNDPMGAGALAALYRAVATDSVKPEATSATLKKGADVVLEKHEQVNKKPAAAWQPFRNEVSNILNERKSRGDLETEAQWDGVLNDVARGLELAAGFSDGTLLAAVDDGLRTGTAAAPAGLPESLAKIIAFITRILPLILEIISLFGGGGGGIGV